MTDAQVDKLIRVRLLATLSPEIASSLGIPHSQLSQLAMGRIGLTAEQREYLVRRLHIEE